MIAESFEVPLWQTCEAVNDVTDRPDFGMGYFPIDFGTGYRYITASAQAGKAPRPRPVRLEA